MKRILPSQVIPDGVVTEGPSVAWKSMDIKPGSTQPEPPHSDPNQAHGSSNASKTSNEQAVEFVIYEIWMVRSCYEKLKSPPQDNFLKNLLIENMVLHTRVLRDFFFTKLDDKKRPIKRDDDILASCYCPSWSNTSDDYSAYLGENQKRMNKALAHLSYDRLIYKGKDKEWSPAALLEEIGNIWFKFLDTLRQNNEPAAGWFKEEASKFGVPVVPPL